MPCLSDIFDAIGETNAQNFTSLDLGKAFWQVPLSEEKKARAASLLKLACMNFKLCPLAYLELLLPFNTKI